MRRLAAAATIAACLLALAGCGSTPDSSSSPSGSSTVTPGPKPTGKSLKIGLINQETETVAFPEGSAAAKASVAYLNAEKGGIGGRPAELVLCTAGDSAESAVACANKFANDPSVPLVIDNTYNSAAVNKILAGKKALFTFNNDVPDMKTKDVYTFDPGLLVPIGVQTKVLADKGVKTVSILYTDDPTVSEGFVPVVEAAMKQAGITVKQKVPVKSGGDYSAAVAAADPTGVDGLSMLLVDNSQCAPVGRALKALGSTATVVSADICSAPAAVASGDVDGWIFPVTNTGSVDASKPGPGTQEFRRILTNYGDGAPNFATLAGYTAAHVFAAADLYQRVGVDKVTAETINSLLARGWKAELLTFPPVTCPGTAPFIGACNTSMFVAESKDAKLVLTSDTPVTVDLAQYAGLVG